MQCVTRPECQREETKFRDLWVGKTDVFLKSFVKDLARLVFALEGSTRAQVASELGVHAAALTGDIRRLGRSGLRRRACGYASHLGYVACWPGLLH